MDLGFSVHQTTTYVFTHYSHNENQTRNGRENFHITLIIELEIAS